MNEGRGREEPKAEDAGLMSEPAECQSATQQNTILRYVAIRLHSKDSAVASSPATAGFEATRWRDKRAIHDAIHMLEPSGFREIAQIT